MFRFGTSLLAIALALPLLGVGEAQAYDSESTHRWITRQAVELLVTTYPGDYDELLEYGDEVIEGSHHEDDIFLDGDTDPATLRVMRHFYHAPDGAGLTFAGTTFPSSYEWHGIENDQNQWDFFDGLHAYQAGDFKEAFFIAGHTVHLISDLTVPAHSHLDDHGPPTGDDYEDYCSERMVNPFETSLRGPEPGTPIPEFLDLHDAFQKTADASYYRNLYPGNLDGNEATGVIAQMFPGMSKGFFSGVWEIDGIGKEGTDFYEEEPGYWYFSRNMASSAFDIVDYDALRPMERQYGPVEGDTMMVERMADVLVPLAIVHSAGVLKLFMDQAHSLPSLVEEPMAPSDPGGCNSSSQASMSWFAALLVLALIRRLSVCVSKTNA